MNMLSTLLLAAGVWLALPFAANGQPATTWPTKPIHIIVPYTAGGVVDTLSRLVGDRLSAKYGQPVVIDNRPGAGGAIGNELAAKAAPDGYTLLCVSPGLAVLPSLQKSANWNPARDFRSVQELGVVPNVFVVPTSLPVKTMAELVELARKNEKGDRVSYASAGIGTSNHLSGELLAQMANTQLTHVPYKGQPDAISDLLAGRVMSMPLTAALALPQIKAGKLRPLAVTTATRSGSLPDVPTVAEALNLPDYEVGTWFGFVVPAKTPEAIVSKLSADVAEIIGRAGGQGEARRPGHGRGATRPRPVRCLHRIGSGALVEGDQASRDRAALTRPVGVVRST